MVRPSKGKRKTSGDGNGEDPSTSGSDQDGAASKRARPGQLNRESLKAAIWYGVAQIVQEEEVATGLSASEQFVATLAELVVSQAEALALDLKDFASHAGRSAIRADDVKLVARKNGGLLDLLNDAHALYNRSATADGGPRVIAGHKAAPGVKPKSERPRPKPAAASTVNAASGSKPPGMPGTLRSRR